MGTTEATLRMENVDVKEEWQDEGLPRYSSQVSMSAVEGECLVLLRGGVQEASPADQARPIMDICCII